MFAPLARLLGLYSIKEELEELAFGYSKPDEYTALRLHLDQLAREQGPTVQWVRSTASLCIGSISCTAEDKQSQCRLRRGKCSNKIS